MSTSLLSFTSRKTVKIKVQKFCGVVAEMISNKENEGPTIFVKVLKNQKKIFSRCK